MRSANGLYSLVALWLFSISGGVLAQSALSEQGQQIVEDTFGQSFSSFPSYTTAQRNQLAVPEDGYAIFNSTTRCINIWINGTWSNFCPDGCILAPSIADAGDDVFIESASGTTTVALSAEAPVSGTGMWFVLRGEDGIVLDPASPVSQFTGRVGQDYVLRWVVTTECAENSDDVEVKIIAVN